MQTFADIYRYRFILESLVAKNFKSMYRNMALGFLWAILNPLVLVTVLSVVWVVFFGADRQFPSMILVTLIPFNFFVYCISGCAVSIPANAVLVKKVAFPRQILPVSVIVTHLIHLGVQFCIVAVALFLLSTPGEIMTARLLWLPLILAVQVALCMALGLLVAGLNVVYRDTQYLVDSTLTVLFWLSPVIYEASPVLRDKHAAVMIVYYLNPISGILDAYRSVLYHGISPDPLTFGMACATTLALGYIGVRVFWIHEKGFADYV